MYDFGQPVRIGCSYLLIIVLSLMNKDYCLPCVTFYGHFTSQSYEDIAFTEGGRV